MGADKIPTKVRQVFPNLHSNEECFVSFLFQLISVSYLMELIEHFKEHKLK